MNPQALDSPRGETRLSRLAPGLLLSATVAAVAIFIARTNWFAAQGLSALTVAIVLGMLCGNSCYGRLAAPAAAGVQFSRNTLLRAAVVLYGLRPTLHDVAQVGFSGVLIDALTLGSTFALALIVGIKVFRLDRTTVMLIGAGSAICGAAAVMATGPVVRGRAEQVTIAVATVVMFGTLAIFAYPALYSLNQHWALLATDQHAYGLYAGSTIHEVAQVFAAGRSVGAAAADTAVITKMVRVMMLAPFLLALSAWLEFRGNGAQARRQITVPWFAFGFIGMVLFNSLALLPPAVVSAASGLDSFLLAMAMAALGFTTQLSTVRKAGVRPLLLAAMLALWLIVGGALINRAVPWLLS